MITAPPRHHRQKYRIAANSPKYFFWNSPKLLSTPWKPNLDCTLIVYNIVVRVNSIFLSFLVFLTDVENHIWINYASFVSLF